MSKPEEAPHGTWKSPLSTDIFAAGAVSLEEVVVNVSNQQSMLSAVLALVTSGSNQTAESTSLR